MQLTIIIDLHEVIIKINIYIQEFISQHRRTTAMIYPALRLYSDIGFEMVMLRIMNKDPESYLNLPLHLLEIIRHCVMNSFRIENQYLKCHGEFRAVTNLLFAQNYASIIIQTTITVMYLGVDLMLFTKYYINYICNYWYCRLINE